MTPLATRLLNRLNHGPATWRMLLHSLNVDLTVAAPALAKLRAAGKVESTECDGVSVYHITTPKPSRPRTARTKGKVVKVPKQFRHLVKDHGHV